MKTKLTILTLLISATLLYAPTTILEFKAESQDNNVLITWKTSSEVNLSHFEIERRTVTGQFMFLARVEPEPDKSYEYVDQTAFKSTDAVYAYRLKIVDKDGQTAYSAPYNVVHRVSSVKRTWGSIKALFR
ncbi:hypothetical protein ACSSWA_11635 [Melioribacter sp. Ez-97]|uniref:hypothetical protein n=1 Tax=Melioribacter sp. Ez-97 TaxID=3423434 RepID=UPI003ED97368